MITLVIMDGFGHSKSKFGNAIYSQGTPKLDKLKKNYIHTTLHASGEFVGLPHGQVGNSEVGHLTIGAGRVLLQDFSRINQSIETNAFRKNPKLIKLMENAKEKGKLHLMGLLSKGGVHSHINHLVEIIKIAKEYKINKIFIHAIADGRDSTPKSFMNYIEELMPFLNDNIKIASVAGRYYAMDRERAYERTEKYYNTVVNCENVSNFDLHEWVEKQYENGLSDEFFNPALFCKDGILKDKDVVLFFNFRPDRTRQISHALTDEKYVKFKTKKLNLDFFSMTTYDDSLNNIQVLFEKEKVEKNLAKLLSKNKKKQLHISETSKYAHVTYFLNGGNENEYPYEKREIVQGLSVDQIEHNPSMKAGEVTEHVLDAISSQKYDFIVVNFPNCDMVGHTGNFNSTKKAVEIVDKCAYAIALATIMAGGECVVTADHGNAESMFDLYGNKIKSHTSNPVPFYLISNKKRKLKKIKNASLANIAPTILTLMELPVENNMENSLI